MLGVYHQATTALAHTMNGLTCAVKPKKAMTARQTVILVFVLIFILYRYTRTALFTDKPRGDTSLRAYLQ